jgi:hypothetical protein
MRTRRQAFVGITGSLLASLILPTFVATVLAAESSETGRISRIRGASTVFRGNASLTLAEGTAIKIGDVISTGNESRLEITFADGSKMILGANAKLTIDSYLYDQGKSAGAALLDLTKGAFRFATGKIASLTDKNIVIKTNFARLTLADADLWGGPIDQQSGVVTIHGSVEVKTSSGAVLLKGANTGTMIASARVAPSALKKWADAKVARALATVAF